VIDGVQAVFMVAAPLAALGLLAVLRLPESKLRTTAEMNGNGGDTDARGEQADDATGARGALREGESESGGRPDSSPVRQPRGAARQPAGA
jgi:hypothetical protein